MEFSPVILLICRGLGAVLRSMAGAVAEAAV